MSGLTWARNEFDDRAVSIGEMSNSFFKIKTQHEAQFGKPLKAVRLSRMTLLSMPLMYAHNHELMDRFYGVPVEIDNSLDLWEFKEVHD